MEDPCNADLSLLKEEAMRQVRWCWKDCLKNYILGITLCNNYGK